MFSFKNYIYIIYIYIKSHLGRDFYIKALSQSAKFRSRIFRIFGDAFGAVMGGTGGVAWCHLRGLGTRYDIKIKTEHFFENTFFSIKFLFSKKYENRKLSKKKVIFRRKNVTFFHWFFIEKVTFLKEIFRFFFFEKNIFCPTFCFEKIL